MMSVFPAQFISTREHVMTPLRRRMIEDMDLKNLSTKSVNTYVARVYNFAAHFGRSPERLGRDDVRAYLLFLIQEKKVSWSVYNQTRCALRFLYEVTLGRKDVLERIPFPKQAKRLPVVLSTDEVAAFDRAEVRGAVVPVAPINQAPRRNRLPASNFHRGSPLLLLCTDYSGAQT
jgi:site-specific recombinase XerD